MRGATCQRTRRHLQFTSSRSVLCTLRVSAVRFLWSRLCCTVQSLAENLLLFRQHHNPVGGAKGHGGGFVWIYSYPISFLRVSGVGLQAVAHRHLAPLPGGL